MSEELHRPTMRLRWSEPHDAYVVKQTYYESSNYEPVRVLQQWWEPAWQNKDGEPIEGEWRDVPIEVEPHPR